MQGNDRPLEENSEEKQVRRPRARSSSTSPQRRASARSGQRQSGNAAQQPEAPRLLKRFRDELAPQLISEFGYTVPLQVPRLEKVVLNVGLGEAIQNPNSIETVRQLLATISSQHPVVTKAKKSIAGFKIREGMPIGVMVTLRARRMYEFMDRLLNAALPRIRDFRGVAPSSFDGRGNYSLGIREQIIFPEVDYNRVDRIRGFQVSIVTTANTDAEAYRLLELMGMPFAKSQNTRG